MLTLEGDLAAAPRVLRHDWPRPGDAGCLRPDSPSRAARAHGARHRRNRHRQGAGGARAAQASVRAAPNASSPSTAPPWSRRCSRASCSATCAAPSPAPPTTRPACSRPPTAARCSSTKSASCRWPCRPSCCACSRTGKCSASARSSRARSTCASSPPPIATCAAEVAAGRFRNDLYYRLNVAEIALPPLRDRREDIPYLTAAFVHSFAQRFGKPLVGLTSDAERLLARRRWDGNVRQLRNVLERACILAEDEFVDRSAISPAVMQPAQQRRRASSVRRAACNAAPSSRPAPLIEIEREHIVRTLRAGTRQQGRRRTAARHQPARVLSSARTARPAPAVPAGSGRQTARSMPVEQRIVNGSLAAVHAPQLHPGRRRHGEHPLALPQTPAGRRPRCAVRHGRCRGARRRAGATGPTSSCSTWRCRRWTASKSAAG